MMDFEDTKHLLLKVADIEIICESLQASRIADQHMMNNLECRDAEECIRMNKDSFERQDALYKHLRIYCSYACKLPLFLTPIKNTYFL